MYIFKCKFILLLCFIFYYTVFKTLAIFYFIICGRYKLFKSYDPLLEIYILAGK